MERYIIKFEKLEGAKYISHLDTMRTLHRAFRRANLPLSYTQGFNPHPNISVAAPLSLGVNSISEYADIDMDEYVNDNVIKEALNKTLPNGLRILLVYHIKDKKPASMAAVKAASYEILLNTSLNQIEVNNVISSILSKDDITKMKKTKSGEKLINFRPFIKEIKLLEQNESTVLLTATLQTGSEGNMNPDMLANIIKEISEDKIFGFPIIKRTQLYSIENDKFIDLFSFFSRK